MTRENKLALVVGFGLILFVGILISDHFSVARTQQSADLTRLAIDDPLFSPPGDEAALVDLRPAAMLPIEPPLAEPALQPGHVAAHAAEIPAPTVVQHQPPTVEQHSFAQEVVSVLARPSFAPPAVTKSTDVKPVVQLPGFVAVEGAAEDQTPADLKIHEIQAGESLVAICRRHYGDANLAKALASFNGLSNPNVLRQGQKIGLPPPSMLGAAPASPAAAPRSAPATAPKPAPKTKTYTVKPGDNLAQIAQRVYGNKNQWRKIFDLNRDVLEDPDTLKAGIVLKVG